MKNSYLTFNPNAATLRTLSTFGIFVSLIEVNAQAAVFRVAQSKIRCSNNETGLIDFST